MTTCIFDRSNPHSVVSFNGERSRTRLDNIRESISERGYFTGRTDIALVNRYEYCDCCCNYSKHVQYAVFPSRDGPYGEGLPLLTEEELRSVREINNKIIEITEEYPEMGVLLGERGV
jgi:hypothetical protein